MLTIAVAHTAKPRKASGRTFQMLGLRGSFFALELLLDGPSVGLCQQARERLAKGPWRLAPALRCRARTRFGCHYCRYRPWFLLLITFVAELSEFTGSYHSMECLDFVFHSKFLLGLVFHCVGRLMMMLPSVHQRQVEVHAVLLVGVLQLGGSFLTCTS